MAGSVVPERIDLVVASGDEQRIGSGSGLCIGDYTILGRARTAAPSCPSRIRLRQMAASCVGIKVVAEDNGLREHERSCRKQNQKRQ